MLREKFRLNGDTKTVALGRIDGKQAILSTFYFQSAILSTVFTFKVPYLPHRTSRNRPFCILELSLKSSILKVSFFLDFSDTREKETDLAPSG